MSSPSQLYSCVDTNAILKSPLNTSKSKHQWSFSKDARFKAKKIQVESFYDLPHTKSNRKAGIGIGKKTDLDFGKNLSHIVPAPTQYNIKSFVDINITEKKGFTPRFSREETAPMSFIDLQARKTPGPGRYDQYRYNDSPYWSMKARGKSQIFLKRSQSFIPGPGQHQNKQVIDPVGKYYLSNHPNSKTKTFNPPRSARFAKTTSDFPGPGTYQPKNDLPADGNYVLSKNKSSRKRSFLLGCRTSFVDETPKRAQTPGPGSYRVPSDFGHYDEKIQIRKGSSASKRTQVTRADK